MSGRWLDLREAAELLGTSTEAVRKRAARGSLRSDRHDGRVVVWVDDGRTKSGRENRVRGDEALVEALTEQVSYLKAQLDIRTEELREHRRLLAGLIERVPELEAPREASEASETVEEGPEGAEPRSSAGGAQTPTRRPQRVTLRSLRRRIFGGS